MGFLYFQEESIMSKKIDSRQEFINPAIYDGQIQKPTEGELQNEYNYLLAEQLTQSLMRDISKEGVPF